ncbi:hypothetical protein O3P69_007133 [Scylla paramamosain]|uniref:Uncharacterized protein n=1 Tax=Scylla paramamosain TaxID=85552 RepID=A0AAW0V5N6_SCYPA
MGAYWSGSHAGRIRGGLSHLPAVACTPSLVTHVPKVGSREGASNYVSYPGGGRKRSYLAQVAVPSYLSIHAPGIPNHAIQEKEKLPGLGDSRTFSSLTWPAHLTRCTSLESNFRGARAIQCRVEFGLLSQAKVTLRNSFLTADSRIETLLLLFFYESDLTTTAKQPRPSGVRE